MVGHLETVVSAGQQCVGVGTSCNDLCFCGGMEGGGGGGGDRNMKGNRVGENTFTNPKLKRRVKTFSHGREPMTENAGYFAN